MRNALPLFTACLLLGACGEHSSEGSQGSNDQASALENAALQSDNAAASELRDQANAIRDSGSGANIADPGSPAQNAMQSAGNAAAANPTNSSGQ